MNKLSLLTLATMSAFAVAGCSRESVGDNTVEAASVTGRIVVNTAVGATRLVYRGARGTYNAVRDARQEDGTSYPPGAVLCQIGEDSFVPAIENPEGTMSCPAI